MSLPEAVEALLGCEHYPRQADAEVSLANVRAMCAAVENANPAHWSEQRVPTTMLSSWSRPELWQPGQDEPEQALQLHYDLKQLLSYPAAIVRSFESVFHAPVHIGDWVSSVQQLNSVSDEKQTRLGTGRFWEIEVTYRNQADRLLGQEIFECFGYRRDSADD